MKSVKYESCIKIRGMTILPPLMNDLRYEEMRNYRNKAINIEKQLKENQRNKEIIQKSLFITNDDDDDDLHNNNELIKNEPVFDVNILSNIGEVINHQATIIDQCFNEISNKAHHLIQDLNNSSTSDINKTDNCHLQLSGNNTPCPASLESLETVINMNQLENQIQHIEDSLNDEEKTLTLIDNFYQDRENLIGYLNENFSSYLPTVVEMKSNQNEINKTERPQTLSLKSSNSEILKEINQLSSSLSNIPSIITNIPSTSSVTDKSLLKSDTTKDSGYDAKTYQIDEDLNTDTEFENELQNDVFQHCNDFIINQTIQQNPTTDQNKSISMLLINKTNIEPYKIDDLENKYDYLGENKSIQQQHPQHLDIESPHKTNNTQDSSYSLIDQSVTLSEISSSPKDISESSDLIRETILEDLFEEQFKNISNEYDKDTSTFRTKSDMRRPISDCSTSTVSLIEYKDAATTWVPDNDDDDDDDFKLNISHQGTSTPRKQYSNKLVQANIDNDFDISKIEFDNTLRSDNVEEAPVYNVQLTISPSKPKHGKCKSVLTYIEKLLEFGISNNRPYFDTSTPNIEKTTSNVSWKSCQSDVNNLNNNPNNGSNNSNNILTYSNGIKQSKSSGNIESSKYTVESLYSLSNEKCDTVNEPAERDQSTPTLKRQASYIVDVPSPLLSAHLQTSGMIGPNDNQVFNAELFVSDKSALIEERNRMESCIIAEATRLNLTPEIIQQSQQRRQAEWAQRRAASEALAEAKKRRESAAATRIVAAARGYLVRRLFKTEHVQTLIRTIKDTLSCAMSIHKIPSLTKEDIELHKRLIMQLNSAVCNIHELFLENSSYDQMQIIAQDRARIMARKRARSRSEILTPQRFISAATERTLKRKSFDRRRPATFDYSSSIDSSHPSCLSPPPSSCSSRKTWSCNESPRSIPAHFRPSQSNIPICDSTKFISGCLTRSLTSHSRREISSRKSDRRSRSSTRKPWR